MIEDFVHEGQRGRAMFRPSQGPASRFVLPLLEELRRDSPSIRNRVDAMAEAMQQPADPVLVSRALDEKDERKP